MVDVSYSPEQYVEEQQQLVDDIIPEDNVERLRNIRDMFENPMNDDDLLLQKVERLQPSEKIMERLSNPNLHEFDLSDKLETNHINVQPPIETTNNPTLGLNSLSDESLSNNENNSDNDTEECLDTDPQIYSADIQEDNFQEDLSKNVGNSILTRMEHSSLIMDDTKEAQRSINGLPENLDTQSSSATSSVSSSTSISSTHADDQQINELKPAEHFTVENSEVKEKLHAESITDFETQDEVEEQVEVETSTEEMNDARFKDGVFVGDDEELENEMEYEYQNEMEIADQQSELREKRYKRKKEKVVPLADMNNVMAKFQNMNSQSDDRSGPKPVRHITPPRIKALYEIENTPAERAEGVVGANDKIEDVKPTAGLIRSRKQQFANNTELDRQSSKSNLSEDIVPGSAKNTAAMFAEDRWAARLKNIEKSGITLEGDIVEKGLAQERLAMFSDEGQIHYHKPTVTEQDSEILNSAKGLAKDRMNIFKHLEQKQRSPPKEMKKLKEFTPPPTLDGQPARQYIIVDKEGSPSSDTGRRDSYHTEEFVPEAGLAKNRMKQYLESQQQSTEKHAHPDEVIGKGYAKNLLNKWKSMETVEGKEGGRRLSKEGSPGSVDFINQDGLVEEGHARNLRARWQNIDNSDEKGQRRPVRQITPPPGEEIHRVNKSIFESPQENHLNKTVDQDQDLVLIGKGSAKNRLANYESNPADSCINSQFCEEEVIPSAGHARNLKAKFMNLEKEASKVETSSSKMNYKPKKFTSSATPQSNAEVKVKQQAQVKKIDASRIAEAAAGPEKPRDTTAKDNAVNAYLSHHTSSLHGGDRCCTCDKTVYAMEKIEADKKIYHKQCFKCKTCNCPLNEEFETGRYVFENGHLFCLKHSTKTPISPVKSNKQVQPLASIHIDTTSAFDSDTSSMNTPITPGSNFSPISPIKTPKKSSAQNSPMKSPMKSPHK